MPHYRKKPVEVEAKELTMASMVSVKSWLASHGQTATDWSKPPMQAITGLLIPTLESPHEASFGDFIIKGVKGEFYPCKPEIFKQTYVEVVTEAELLDILSWDTDPDEEGPLPDRIETHDGTWVRDDAPDTWYFEWSVE